MFVITGLLTILIHFKRANWFVKIIHIVLASGAIGNFVPLITTNKVLNFICHMNPEGHWIVTNVADVYIEVGRIFVYGLLPFYLGRKAQQVLEKMLKTHKEKAVVAKRKMD